MTAAGRSPRNVEPVPADSGTPRLRAKRAASAATLLQCARRILALNRTRRRAPLPPAFNRLAWSNLAAQSAEQVGLAAAPIVAVLALGAGAGETGLLQAIQTLPFLLLAIPAGLLADRTPRRRLMVIGESLRVLSFISILAA